jgi:hypothetical protein
MRNTILITNSRFYIVSYSRKTTTLTPIAKKVAKLLIAGGMPHGS